MTINTKFDYSDEDISAAIEYAISVFSKKEKIDMRRMEAQIKVAKEVLGKYKAGNKHVILEAPTGYGKSIFGMFMIYVFKHLRSSKNPAYMLTSTKLLQAQYIRDIDYFNMNSDLASLSGQSNYACTKNDETFATRACGEYSTTSIPETHFPCVIECPYLVARNAAVEKTAVLNYSYWLYQLNLVGPHSKFSPRALTVFDECHLIGDIVQDIFSLEININYFLRTTVAYFKMVEQSRGIDSDVFTEEFVKSFYQHIDDFVEATKQIDVYQDAENSSVLLESLKAAYKSIAAVESKYSIIYTAYIKDKDTPELRKTLLEYEKQFIDTNNYIMNMAKTLSSLCDTFSRIGADSIVATVYDNEADKIKPVEKYGKASMKIVKIQNLDESALINDHVIKHTEFGLWMSATIGNIDEFADQYGIENYAKIYVDTDFDFTASPIIKVSPMLSMTYKNKEANMKAMIDRILDILEQHPNEKGIIHTGNYQFAAELMKTRNRRLIDYNSKNKIERLQQHAESDNGVIIGPSLLEGLDLKDDLARFMIFMKVPYPSLQDKFIKRKMNKFAFWYIWATSLAWLQALGRPIRNNKDWCITYLLDESFNSFLDRAKLPAYVKQRITTKSANSNQSLDDELNDLSAFGF